MTMQGGNDQFLPKSSRHLPRKEGIKANVFVSVKLVLTKRLIFNVEQHT